MSAPGPAPVDSSSNEGQGCSSSTRRSRSRERRPRGERSPPPDLDTAIANIVEVLCSCVEMFPELKEYTDDLIENEDATWADCLDKNCPDRIKYDPNKALTVFGVPDNLYVFNYTPSGRIVVEQKAPPHPWEVDHTFKIVCYEEYIIQNFWKLRDEATMNAWRSSGGSDNPTSTTLECGEFVQYIAKAYFSKIYICREDFKVLCKAVTEAAKMFKWNIRTIALHLAHGYHYYRHSEAATDFQVLKMEKDKEGKAHYEEPPLPRYWVVEYDVLPWMSSEQLLVTRTPGDHPRRSSQSPPPGTKGYRWPKFEIRRLAEIAERNFPTLENVKDHPYEAPRYRCGHRNCNACSKWRDMSARGRANLPPIAPSAYLLPHQYTELLKTDSECRRYYYFRMGLLDSKRIYTENGVVFYDYDFSEADRRALGLRQPRCMTHTYRRQGPRSPSPDEKHEEHLIKYLGELIEENAEVADRTIGHESEVMAREARGQEVPQSLLDEFNESRAMAHKVYCKMSNALKSARRFRLGKIRLERGAAYEQEQRTVTSPEPVQNVGYQSLNMMLGRLPMAPRNIDIEQSLRHIEAFLQNIREMDMALSLEMSRQESQNHASLPAHSHLSMRTLNGPTTQMSAIFAGPGVPPPPPGYRGPRTNQEAVEEIGTDPATMAAIQYINNAVARTEAINQARVARRQRQKKRSSPPEGAATTAPPQSAPNTEPVTSPPERRSHLRSHQRHSSPMRLSSSNAIPVDLDRFRERLNNGSLNANTSDNERSRSKSPRTDSTKNSTQKTSGEKRESQNEHRRGSRSRDRRISHPRVPEGAAASERRETGDHHRRQPNEVTSARHANQARGRSASAERRERALHRRREEDARVQRDSETDTMARREADEAESRRRRADERAGMRAHRADRRRSPSRNRGQRSRSRSRSARRDRREKTPEARDIARSHRKDRRSGRREDSSRRGHNRR